MTRRKCWSFCCRLPWQRGGSGPGDTTCGPRACSSFGRPRSRSCSDAREQKWLQPNSQQLQQFKHLESLWVPGITWWGIGTLSRTFRDPGVGSWAHQTSASWVPIKTLGDGVLDFQPPLHRGETTLRLASGEWRQQARHSPAWAETFVPCAAISVWSGALLCTCWDWGLTSGKCSWALGSFPVSQFQGLAMKWIKSLFFSSNAVNKEEETWILYC